MGLGIYIHVPFCTKKCNYCSFYSVCLNEELLNNYLNGINSAIVDWSKRLSSSPVDTIYFGGGTPSLLGTNILLKITETIDKSFNIVKNAEITTEINPRSGARLNYKALKENGFNRISMGMQSSDEKELSLLGRTHNNTDVINVVDKITSAGITNYSLDVMLGIPHQTKSSLEKTLDFVTDLNATHISTYILKIEKNTPFYVNENNLKFADEDTQADLYEFTSQYLKRKNFRHYEISNFCKKDKISHHNMKYWELEDYLGIGPAAHSLIKNKRFYYPNDISAFINGETIYESEGKTPEEYIMLSLRTDTGVLFDKFKKLFKRQIPEHIILRAKSLEKLSLVKISDKNIVLTEKGYLLSNTIISELLSKGIE